VNQPCNSQSPVARSGDKTHHGSITSAHASVGAAATWPTSGTIFNPADANRHGAAATPHPANPTNVAHSATIAHHFT
jgi:hypothetical protein